MKTTLTCDDCRKPLREIETATADVIVTSPPYNIGKQYGASYNDSASREAFKAFCADWILLCRMALKEDGSFFLNVGSTPANPLLPYELASMCADVLTLQNVFHWIKAITVTPRNSVTPFSVGHFKPINSPRFVTDCHEFVFHFTVRGDVKIDRLALGVPYTDKSNVKRWQHTGGKDLRCRGNTWFVPYPTRRKASAHPAPFPERLVENCIRLHGVGKTKTVLDPFMGSGTSGVVAKRLGVEHFIGFEIEPSYFVQAKHAIEKA